VRFTRVSAGPGLLRTATSMVAVDAHALRVVFPISVRTFSNNALASAPCSQLIGRHRVVWTRFSADTGHLRLGSFVRHRDGLGMLEGHQRDIPRDELFGTNHDSTCLKLLIAAFFIVGQICMVTRSSFRLLFVFRVFWWRKRHSLEVEALLGLSCFGSGQRVGS